MRQHVDRPGGYGWLRKSPYCLGKGFVGCGCFLGGGRSGGYELVEGKRVKSLGGPLQFLLHDSHHRVRQAGWTGSPARNMHRTGRPANGAAGGRSALVGGQPATRTVLPSLQKVVIRPEGSPEQADSHGVE